MSKLFRLLVLLLVTISFALKFSTSIAYAQEEYEVGFETINPGNPLYNVKRIFEKIQIRFSDSREFKYKLLDRRFKELVFVAKEKRESQIETAASRFMTQVGEIVDTESVSEEKSEMTAEYKHYLEESRDLYEANSAYWLVLQQSSELANKLIKSEN